MPKGKMRTDKKTLNLRSMGISNWAYDPKDKKRYSIQFYDFDYNGTKKITRNELIQIANIFPYDCIMYETKHGVHFISFSLLKGLTYTKSKVLELSKSLGKQDYWSEGKDLTLRISPKWKVISKRKRETISKKPKFKGLFRAPNKYRISKKHLEFYRKYMGLPEWVYNLYNDCDKKDLKIKLYHYKTRD